MSLDSGENADKQKLAYEGTCEGAGFKIDKWWKKMFKYQRNSAEQQQHCTHKTYTLSSTSSKKHAEK